MKLIALASLCLALSSGCAFHSTATHWNGVTGANGKPVYVKTTSSVGLNFLVALKLFGATNIDSLVDEMTAEIAEEGGDRVRIIQSSSENYWYGFPPFTWILTPVITTVAADYEPDPEARLENEAEQAAEEAGD